MNRQPQSMVYDLATKQESHRIQFLQSWNVYTSSFLHPRTCPVGEHQDDPKYALRSRWGKFGRPALFLHAGPTKRNAKVAAIKHVKHYNPLKAAYWVPTQKNDFKVLLPKPNTGSTRFKAKDCDAINVTCPPQALIHRVFQFSLDVPGLGYSQSFEWRHSRGEDVKHLQSGPNWLSKMARGWKLVWLNSRGDDAMVGGRGEVVAVWARSAFKGRKLAEFEFVNSGKGQLGDQFMLVAAITGMQILQIELTEEQERASRQTQRC